MVGGKVAIRGRGGTTKQAEKQHGTRRFPASWPIRLGLPISGGKQHWKSVLVMSILEP